MVKESFLHIEEAQSNPFAPSGSSETNERRQILLSGRQGIKLNEVDKVYKTPELKKQKTNKRGSKGQDIFKIRFRQSHIERIERFNSTAVYKNPLNTQ